MWNFQCITDGNVENKLELVSVPVPLITEIQVTYATKYLPHTPEKSPKKGAGT